MPKVKTATTVHRAKRNAEEDASLGAEVLEREVGREANSKLLSLVEVDAAAKRGPGRYMVTVEADTEQ